MTFRLLGTDYKMIYKIINDAEINGSAIVKLKEQRVRSDLTKDGLIVKLNSLRPGCLLNVDDCRHRPGGVVTGGRVSRLGEELGLGIYYKADNWMGMSSRGPYVLYILRNATERVTLHDGGVYVGNDRVPQITPTGFFPMMSAGYCRISREGIVSITGKGMIATDPDAQRFEIKLDSAYRTAMMKASENAYDRHYL